jgi:hypothetical protein
MAWRLMRFALVLLLAGASASCRSTDYRVERFNESHADVGLHVSLVPIGGYPQFLHAADGFIWGVGGRPQFWKIEQATNVVSEVPIRWPQREVIADFAVGHGSVWISTYPPLGAGQRTQRFDAITGESVGAIDFGGALAVGDDALWTFDERSGMVRRIDPATLAVVRAIGCRPKWRRLLARGSDLWMLGVEDGVLTHIDGGSNTVVWEGPAGEPHESNLWRFFIGGDRGFYSGVLVTDAAVWVTDQRATSRLFSFEQPDGTIARVDPAQQVAALPQTVGRWPMSPVEFAGSIWITVANDQKRVSLGRIDPNDGRVMALHELPRHRLFLPDSCQTMVAGDDALWIGADGVMQKIEVGPAIVKVE